MSDTGSEIWRRYLEGDKSAFNDLVTAYRDSLIFFINRYVHNLAEAEDVSEDVFVELLVHKSRYNFKTSFKTYIFTVARNKAVDRVRKKARHPEISESFVESRQDVMNIEDEFLKRERSAEIHRALETLNVDYRTALHLVYFEEMSYREAAKVMNKSEKQLTNLVYRAKLALKEALGEEADGVEK